MTRVMITGGSGFLGRYVAAEFNKTGVYEVAALSRRDGDLRDKFAVRRIFLDIQPEIVVHLAAVVGGIGANQEMPGTFFFDNAMMGLLVMEEARRADVKKFVSVGTVCEYPKFTSVPFEESSLWAGYPEETNAPYGLAKKMLLVQGQAYQKEYGFNAIHLLPANLYGPGDNFQPATSHVIPALVRRFLEAVSVDAERVTCWGTGDATREFLFVKDCARGILLATEHYDAADPVNLGTGVEISIRDLAAQIAGLIGFEGHVVFDANHPDGQPRRCLDVSRAHDLFQFTASMKFDVGLRETVDWYRKCEAERRAS